MRRLQREHVIQSAHVFRLSEIGLHRLQGVPETKEVPIGRCIICITIRQITSAIITRHMPIKDHKRDRCKRTLLNNLYHVQAAVLMAISATNGGGYPRAERRR